MGCVDWRPTRGVNCLLDQICLNRTVEPPVLESSNLSCLAAEEFANLGGIPQMQKENKST